jgi:class 3 adenylate cyclase
MASEQPGANALDRRMSGSFASRYAIELLANTAQFPIANILFELLLEGPAEYFRAPDFYSIVTAALLQAWVLVSLTHPGRWQLFAGNLVAPALYTALEAGIEGAVFFEAPHHWAYWGFALLVGALQAYRLGGGRRFEAQAIVAEELLRACILAVMYALFERAYSPARNSTFAGFMGNTSHQFVLYGALLLGLALGYAKLNGARHLDQLRRTTLLLRTYSEWLLGKRLLAQSMTDPDALALKRPERAVLFMDVRGFTTWSESRTPEEVLHLLNGYYRNAEQVLDRHETIKFKLSADEVMAVLPDAATGLQAAEAMRLATAAYLAPFGIAAGIGLHFGPVIEGVFGAEAVRFYDVLGDVVNTAKRIEGAAGGGEVLVSDALVHGLGRDARVGAARELVVKGKSAPVRVYPLLAK